MHRLVRNLSLSPHDVQPSWGLQNNLNGEYYTFGTGFSPQMMSLLLTNATAVEET